MSALGKVVAAVVGLAVGIGGVLVLREATLSTHQPVPDDSRVAVVLDVDTRNRERDQSPAEMVEALLTVCRLEVSSDLVGAPREVEPGRFEAVLEPALDETNRRQFRGCVEDWTLDSMQAHVRSLEAVPSP